MKAYNPKTIVCARQNHPELVVRDAITEFNLSDAQANLLRVILLYRGINKWLYCRLKFIELKHKLKDRMQNPKLTMREREIIKNIHGEMQQIAKMPRWVEWSPKLHNIRKAKEEIRILKR